MGSLMQMLLWHLTAAGRSQRNTLRSVLAQLLPKEVYAELVAEHKTSASLFEQCVSRLAVDEGKLLSACASLMNITALRRLPLIRKAYLPEGLTLEECRHECVCPIIEDAQIVSYAVIDPRALRSFIIRKKLPMKPAVLVVPQQIIKALSDSLHESEKEEIHHQASMTSKAEDVLKEVTYQAMIKGADAVVIFEELEGALSYEASCAGKIVAKGKVSYLMKDALGFWFKQYTSSKVTFDFESVTLTIAVAIGLDKHLGILTLSSHHNRDEDMNGVITKGNAAHEHEPSKITIETLREESLLPKILVVEDNPTLARVLHRLLISHGYNVVAAPHGAVACEIMEFDEHIEAVICDIHMPKMNGLQFVTHVRNYNGNIPLIVLTSDNDPQLEFQSIERGADVFLTKDVDPELLLLHLKRRLSSIREIVRSTSNKIHEVSEDPRC